MVQVTQARIDLLALCRVRGISWFLLAREARRADGVARLVRADVDERSKEGLAAREVLREASAELELARADVARILADAERTGLELTTVLDDDYPLNLRTIFNAPSFLFCRGRLDAEADARSIAVVGTRAASTEGLKRARKMARLLVENEVTVLSGLARGIDTHLPPKAGRLVSAEAKFNGPSGRSLDEHFLGRLGLRRSDAWLCDLVPHTCLNASQGAALKAKYETRQEELGLPEVDLLPVPKRFADATRRAEILSELRESRAEVLVLLGDKPIQYFLKAYAPRWKRLSDFGTTSHTYGQLHAVILDDFVVRVLPVAHPRQVSALGTHSSRWRDLHAVWVQFTS